MVIVSDLLIAMCLLLIEIIDYDNVKNERGVNNDWI